eukprot:CAMPEP_0182912708 /NCGR_PEP_ID=MMETSP0034_2-20130328/37660_1 /TAXON_ID=156128 /ORGANISM="Nephroselmis pyriformis, Strain CCMP717" /LENGTH=156 /DNA_ID=CAMNT_0025049397 /DNA_START=31 /DNA_END=501 /DNA_ORIENTATION=+
MASSMTSSFAGARVAQKVTISKKATRTVATCSIADGAKQAAKFAFAATTSFALAASANAATIKLGSDSGELAFVPASIKVKAGETITFVNNKAFPHNVVFDEDNVPEGVNADAISHEDYLNGPGDSVTNKFDKPGTYGYYCEPHQGAGMTGEIIVE